MKSLHIVQGGIDNGDKRFLEQAARNGKEPPHWIVPKSSQIGDDIVVFVGHYGFFATAEIDSVPTPRRGWAARYGARLTKIQLIEPPISLFKIRRSVPQLTWANYPRSITTPSAQIAAKIRVVIHDRRESGQPDLDEESLDQANIDELRRVALLSAKPSASKREATVIHRARSRAIHRYVLKRSNGRCEGCGQPAPFRKPDGNPYLEPHHTTQLADEGPDHPAHVLALCPTCHRRAHYADNATSFNRSLIKRAARIESRV